MSLVTPKKMSAPPVIAARLSALRGQLTRWLTIHGAGRWLAIVLAIILADIFIDRVFQMDLAQRTIMLVVMTGTALWFLFLRVLRPLMVRTSDDALVAKVEQITDGSNEQILSTLQLAREADLAQTGTSKTLVEATIADGIARARSLDFSQALDHKQHRKDVTLLALVGGVLALLAIGVLATGFLGTWFSRNVMLSSVQWPQPTYLEIAGAADGKMVLPLGAKHKQIVTITEDSSVTDVNVSLEVEGVSGNRTTYPMTTTGKLDGRERVYEINVTNEFRFRATTGNGMQTDWIDVTYVEPPAVVDLQLTATAPAYTRLEPAPLTGGGPYAVLEGSRLAITASSNKPLASATLAAAGEAIPIRLPDGDPTKLSITVPGATVGGDTGADDERDTSLAGGEYELKLVDQSGLANIRRSRFTVTIKEDQAPKLRTDLLGISGLVTQRAILPMAFQAADDYGLSQTWFHCRWREPEDLEDTPEKTRQVYFEVLPVEGPVITLKDAAVLDLEPLALPQGTSLRVTMNVNDTKPVTPNQAASKEFLLRVVSDEELRSDLLRREIEQRKSFEQIYQAQLELMSAVEVVSAREIPEGMDPGKFHQQLESQLIDLIRDQKGVGTSVDRIANRFEEFLVEVKNNRLDEAENELAPEQRIETRFDEKIIRPIRNMDQNMISVANRNMDNCRRLTNDAVALGDAVAQTIAIQQEILTEMKVILEAMNTSENFQEIINEMLNVKASTKSISTGIKQLKSKQTIDSEEDAQGIFDD